MGVVPHIVSLKVKRKGGKRKKREGGDGPGRNFRRRSKKKGERRKRPLMSIPGRKKGEKKKKGRARNFSPIPYTGGEKGKMKGPAFRLQLLTFISDLERKKKKEKGASVST